MGIDNASSLTLRGADNAMIYGILGLVLFGGGTVYFASQGGWVGAVLCAALTIMSIGAVAQARRARLTLTPQGIEYVSAVRWGSFSCTWSETESFAADAMYARGVTQAWVVCNLVQNTPAGPRQVTKKIPVFEKLDGQSQVELLEKWQSQWAPRSQ